jgi:hypothetical protein
MKETLLAQLLATWPDVPPAVQLDAVRSDYLTHICYNPTLSELAWDEAFTRTKREFLETAPPRSAQLAGARFTALVTRSLTKHQRDRACSELFDDSLRYACVRACATFIETTYLPPKLRRHLVGKSLTANEQLTLIRYYHADTEFLTQLLPYATEINKLHIAYYCPSALTDEEVLAVLATSANSVYTIVSREVPTHSDLRLIAVLLLLLESRPAMGPVLEEGIGVRPTPQLLAHLSYLATTPSCKRSIAEVRSAQCGVVATLPDTLAPSPVVTTIGLRLGSSYDLWRTFLHLARSQPSSDPISVVETAVTLVASKKTLPRTTTQRDTATPAQ